jgi:hypothetical protein
LDIDEGLRQYLSAVKQRRSLAASRGEVISASYLSRQLGKLFTVTEPEVVQGPRTDWTQVVLSQESLQSVDDSTYILGESVIRISDVDMDLISSDRPRQFLTPWPPTSDLQKEVEISNAITAELGDLMKALSSCELEL